MKRCFVPLAFLLCSLSMAGIVRDHGQLSVREGQLVDSSGLPVVLRGVSFGWHNWWPRFYNPSSVRVLASSWNCTVVRAAMGITPKGAYLDRPAWSEQTVRAVVDAAIREDIYVIIDWHSHEINLEEARKFFVSMAKRYGKHPHVIYEIFNEPVNQSWEDVKAYSLDIIKSIREIDPDNIILVGTPHWNQDLHLAAGTPIKGYDNLMYTVHFYAAGHGKALRDRCDTALEQGLPLFVSECASMSPNGDGEPDLVEWDVWMEWMEGRNISWVVWSIADKDETCSMLKPSATSEGPWNNDELKAAGLLTKSYLKQARKGSMPPQKHNPPAANRRRVERQR